MMTDLRGEFTPELESDSASGTIFKTVAALIVVLMLGAAAAYFYFGSGMSNAPATRVALVTPPTVPLKPVIAPQMVAPPLTPQASAAPVSTKANPTDRPVNATTPTHPRRHTAQQSADLQPAANAPPAAATTDSPTLTAPAPPAPEPAQPADPVQPAPQP
jgi:hypothetical protein